MLNNSNFYPTPPALIKIMADKIKGSPKRILDPQAGKADLIEGLKKYCRTYSDTDCSSRRFSFDSYPFENAEYRAIEIDPLLQDLLRGKGIKLIDTDFLNYTGPDKFDLIIMNPPFDSGDKHLMKAIDILYNGQILCLLNAETLKNPFTRQRQELVERLKELGAEIEFHSGAFQEAERKTSVEVALIDITITRDVESDLFENCDDHATRAYQTVKDANELSTGKSVQELVADYNRTVQSGTEVIVNYYQNYHRIGKYLGLNGEARERSHSSEQLTTMLQDNVNQLLQAVRTDFWRKVLNLREVQARMTSKKNEEFEVLLQERSYLDFTESNIRQFVLNLIAGYEGTLSDAVLDIFDKMTIRHSYTGDLYEKNIHYYNGWKTNKAFRVGNRVVIPISGSYGGAFFDTYFQRWSLNYTASQELRDIDVVMNYFDGMSHYSSLSQAIEKAFLRGESKGESTYFKFICHKKGTIHLTFKDENILRRFNVVACRGKGWLPQGYGNTAYAQLGTEEQAVVDSFEGKESYSKNLGQPLFASKSIVPQLAAA